MYDIQGLNKALNVMGYSDGYSILVKNGVLIVKHQQTEQTSAYVDDFDIDALIVEYDKVMAKKAIQDNIDALEKQQTSRRQREAYLNASGKQWMQDLDDAIAVERAKLAALNA